MTLEEIVSSCLRGLEPQILEEMPLRLSCDCSRDYIERVLLSMGESEIRDLIKTQGGCEVAATSAAGGMPFQAGSLRRCLNAGKSGNDRPAFASGGIRRSVMSNVVSMERPQAYWISRAGKHRLAGRYDEAMALLSRAQRAVRAK